MQKRIVLSGTPIQVSVLHVIYMHVASLLDQNGHLVCDMAGCICAYAVLFRMNILSKCVTDVIYFVLQNDLKEFHSLVEFCNPGVLG